MIAAHGVTDIGTLRKHNEDTILCDAALGLYVVADGMGGVNAGEVASRLAVDTVRTFIERTAEDRELTWPFGLDPSLSYDGNRVRTAVKLANRAVHRSGEAQEEYTGMGTTIAVVLMDGRSASICGVGDSRVYSVTPEGVTQLTADHTWVETIRAQSPDIDPEALARHPMRHVLTSVIGGQADVDATVTDHQLDADERLVICSDGIYRGLSDEALATLARRGSVDRAADGILAAALKLDGRDNLSVIVLGSRK